MERILENIGIEVPPEAKIAGLKAEQPCRLERVPDSQLAQRVKGSKMPIVYMDVCHNPQGVEAVIKEVGKRHPMSKILVVCGFSKQKDMTAMLHFLATNSHVKSIYPVTSNHFKLSTIGEINEKINDAIKLLHSYDSHGNPFKTEINNGDIPSTLTHVTQEAADHQDVVLVCGSFFIMPDVRQFFHYDDEYDPQDVNAK